MSKRCLTRGLRWAAVVALGVIIVTPAASAVPKPGAPRRSLRLFSGFLSELTANRFSCGINAEGKICVDPKGSSTVGGGFWPQKPDQYVYGAGTQVAGVVDAAAGFEWAGDTTGAFFEDPSGFVENGDKLSLIWLSTDAGDNANWPRDAYVPADNSLYAPILQHRKAASQQDAWARYWDGNPAANAGRPHPLGVMVDQRGMGWNYPSGNEDIQYWIFTITNITASKHNFYQPRPDADSLESYGRQFKALNDAAFTVSIPDTGYTITNAYFAFAIDADVDAGGARQNLTTANLPFNMGIAFKSNWYVDPNTSGWAFPSATFASPFAPTSGAVGVKYLKSPYINPGNPSLGEIGLVLYGATVNAGAFGDAQNAAQLYRYLSGTLDVAKGDAPCNYPLSTGQTRAQAHVCYVPTTPDDVRFFQSSGPFTLKPGESQTIAVALIAAAPVDNPAIKARGPGLVFPTGTGAFPTQPESLATGSRTLNALDSIFGALSLSDTSGDGKITQDEINVVPKSLFYKGLVAQGVFDNRFLLPFAPDAPNFFLIPGDNQVTVVWTPSTTEASPDPYFAVASNPLSGKLYDPNYRDLDVQGYRIYRGRNRDDLQPIAQFDYAGKEFIDFTAAFQYGNCAPDQGLAGTTNGCPADLATGHPVPIVSPFVQITGRVQTAVGTTPSGNVVVIESDTAVTGGGKPFTPLTNNGVPFSFVDRTPLNGFTYFYVVSAFDINSVKSVGLNYTSLEGKGTAKQVVPRKSAPNASAAKIRTPVLVGDDGTVIDPTTAAGPTINAATGALSGNMAPVNGVTVVPGGVPELLVNGVPAKVLVDSITAGFTGGIGAAPTAYLKFIGAAGDTVPGSIALPEPAFSDSVGVTAPFGAFAAVVPFDTALGKTLGFTSAFMDSVNRFSVAFSGVTFPVAQVSPGIAVIQGRYGLGTTANRFLAHSRWSDEGGAEPANPTIVGLPDSSHNSGKLTGVGRIWSPQTYRDAAAAPGAGNINVLLRGYTYGQTAWYPADFTVTWNADSSVSVRDVTHHVNVRFSPNGGGGWGFINLRAFTAAGVTQPEIEDGTGTPSIGAVGYHHIYATQPTCYPDWFAITCVQLERKAQFEPLDFNYDGATDADGIALSVNGEVFIMEMNAIPAAGTRWHLRAVSGNISAKCTPDFGPVMTSCNTYSFSAFSPRGSLVPGLAYGFEVTQRYHVDSTTSGDLSKIHTVPDPYYVTSAYEQTTTSKALKFVNLPSQCIIRIYSLSGVLVNVITLNDPSGGGEAEWNLQNRNQQVVASGVYFYHVEARDGQTKIGRFTVVNYAQ